LADAANGVGEVFARSVNVEEKICVDGQCLTKDDISSLLQLASSAASEASGSSSQSTTTTNYQLPTINLIGNNPAHIAINSIYSDLGATATTTEDGETISLDITTYLNGIATSSIQLDTSTTTTYEIIYEASHNSQTATSSRTVIVDPEPEQEETEETNEEEENQASSTPTTLPTITLLGDEITTLYTNQDYTDEGVTHSATSTLTTLIQQDGQTLDITNPNDIDTSTTTSYSITYTATAEADNTLQTSTNRTVNIIEDTTAPTITILGTNPLTLTISTSSDPYTDLSATVTDNADQNPTLTTTGVDTVDTTTANTYQILYTATDSAGNISTSTRSVIIEAPIELQEEQQATSTEEIVSEEEVGE